MENLKIIVAATALAIAAGCQITDTASPGQTVPEGEPCTLNVNLADSHVSSKATGQTLADESMIQNVQIFVFRVGDGENEVLDASVSLGFDTELNHNGYTSSFGGISVECTVGEREVWAVVNSATDYTKDGTVGNLDALKAKTSSLSENSTKKLFMLGSARTTLMTGTSDLSISVKRVCASVILESVTNQLTSYALRRSGAFRLKDIYLVNVPAKVNYGLTQSPSSLSSEDWYAKLGKEADEDKYALIRDKQDAFTLDYGESYTTAHTFYSYPNDCAPQTSATWSPRATRIVVEAEYYDGTQWIECYYPVTMYNEETEIGLMRNRQYKVRLTIMRPGSDSPDKPVEFNTVSGSIVVEDWESGASYTETI